MNILSLFDGISCGQLALQRAGIKYSQYFASEIDDNAVHVTQHHFPDTIQLGDATKIQGMNLPKIDLLIGGSPCQGFSYSGSRMNFSDSRSQLFFEFVRLVDEASPTHFILENVMMKKEWQDTISQYMNVEPVEINSSLVSAQHRRRLYWTDFPTIAFPGDCGITFGDIREHNVDFKYYYPKSAMAWFSGMVGVLNKDVKMLGDESKTPTLTASTGYSRERFYGIEDVMGIRRMTPLEYERAQTLPDNYTAMLSDNQRYKTIGNGWTVDVVACLLEGFKETSVPNVKSRKKLVKKSYVIGSTRKNKKDK